MPTFKCSTAHLSKGQKGREKMSGLPEKQCPEGQKKAQTLLNVTEKIDSSFTFPVTSETED